MINALAGKLSPKVISTEYYRMEFARPSGILAPVKFGTSGHRGELGIKFSEQHVMAIAQAVADIEKGNPRPILIGGDTRLMSDEAARICAEVLVGNGLIVALAEHPVPTPVFSHTILSGRASSAMIATASHNPAEEMGLKYNPSHGGPAEEAITKQIADRANAYLADPSGITRVPLSRHPSRVLHMDLVNPYIQALKKMVDFNLIRGSGLNIGIHPLGGTSSHYFSVIGHELKNLEVVDTKADPRFWFIPCDHDGKIRMDPSSKYPMSALLKHLKPAGGKDFVGATDPDADRFGVGTLKGGLINPNHALAVIFNYLINPENRNWPQTLGVGRTIGTTHLLDRIAKAHGRPVDEVNVGFKFFVEGLRAGLAGKYALAGEESAGLSIFNWTTEKDGLLAVLLLAEITARTGKDIRELYDEIMAAHGTPFYVRLDIPTTVEFMEKVKKELKITAVQDINEFGGESVTGRRDSDGLKIYTDNAWFLIRGSGTEPHMLKAYGESFLGEDHLKKLLDEALDKLIGLNGIMKYPDLKYNWSDYEIIS